MPEQPQFVLPKVMSASEHMREFKAGVQSCGPGDIAGITTMQIASQPALPGSPVLDVVHELIEAHERGVESYIAVDARYVERMTRIGRRDLPNVLPLFRANDRKERRVNREATNALLQTLGTLGMLREAEVQVVDRGYTPLLRHIPSLHAGQAFAVRHAKESHIQKHDGESIAYVTNANFTDSDLVDGTMNNVSVRLDGGLARFVIGSMNDGYGRTSGFTRYTEANVTAIHDINNTGNPGDRSRIVEEALATIDPRRSGVVHDPDQGVPKSLTHAAFMSQYMPDGHLYAALEAFQDSADIYMPIQPPGDYRVRSFPYNLHSLVQGQRLANTQISTVNRPIPSHVKALIARYDDGTARTAILTDNCAVQLQKIVRNEELGVFIDLDLKDDSQFEYFEQTVNVLHGMGELDNTARDSFLAW